MRKRAMLPILLAGSILAALGLGSTAMDSRGFWQGLLGAPGYETQTIILYTIRLPRVLAAAVAGAGLSLSGLLLQKVTDNDLASPNIIGVNSGAGFAVILLLMFYPRAVYSLPGAAFLGAFLTSLFIAAASEKIGGGRAAVILAGVAVTALLNAGISFISLLDADVLTAYNYFSIGGVAGVRLRSLPVPAVVIALCFMAAMAAAGKIDLLCLGDGMAASLGLRVRRLRLLCLILASAAAGAAVSFAGLLGFVGLAAPHMAKKLAGSGTRQQLWASVQLGAVLVVLGDLAGRTLFAPSELPVGIMMALVGAPFFFGLLMSKRRTYAEN